MHSPGGGVPANYVQSQKRASNRFTEFAPLGDDAARETAREGNPEVACHIYSHQQAAVPTATRHRRSTIATRSPRFSFTARRYPLHAFQMSAIDVTERTERYIRQLIIEDRLPPDVMERARRFLYCGDLSPLFELPLPLDAMMQAGRVLTCALPLQAPPPAPLPTLSSATREQLRALANEAGTYAEAALFILSRDLQARAFNRSLDDCNSPPH